MSATPSRSGSQAEVLVGMGSLAHEDGLQVALSSDAERDALLALHRVPQVLPRVDDRSTGQLIVVGFMGNRLRSCRCLPCQCGRTTVEEDRGISNAACLSAHHMRQRLRPLDSALTCPDTRQ